MMKKTILLALALATVLVPAALATTPAQTPSAFCKANTGLVGATKTYRNNGDCVSKQAALANANRTNAAKACKAEMADVAFASSHNSKTFDQYYGTTADKGNGKGNAYGNCVSQKASGKTGQQQTAMVNAAKKCKAAPLKDQIGAAPKTYRTFGACVAAQTKTS